MHYPHLIKIKNLQSEGYFYGSNLWPTVPAAGSFLLAQKRNRRSCASGQRQPEPNVLQLLGVAVLLHSSRFLNDFTIHGLSTGNYMRLPTATVVFHPGRLLPDWGSPLLRNHLRLQDASSNSMSFKKLIEFADKDGREVRTAGGTLEYLRYSWKFAREFQCTVEDRNDRPTQYFDAHLELIEFLEIL